MLENYKILTVTHRQTNVKNIGNFVVSATDDVHLKQQLHQLKQRFQLEEFFYLSTCNRVMYFFQTKAKVDATFQYNFFQQINPELSATQISTDLSCYEGEASLEHLFEVAASVDSMVVGEHEILRQLREAYDRSLQFGLTGDAIRLAINQAVQAAKSVYSNTRIGEKPVSIVSLAIQKLRGMKLAKDARILLIGAGQTNTLVSKFLKKYEYSNITIFNRTLERATQLAKAVEGTAYPLDALASYTEGFDCMIVCTGATKAIVEADLYAQLLQGETNSKLVIDLSIPNNVHKQTVQEFAMKYIEIDDLRTLAKQNLAFRATEVKRAKKLLQTCIADFPKLYNQRQLERAMRSVPEEIKAIKNHAMNNVFKKEVDQLDEDTRLLLERMLNYMEKKCISIPMKAAKEVVL